MKIKQLLDWNLKAGSHGFPSEGTCLNEAAIVAAGLEYREVLGPESLPECFSKVIGAYVIIVNDTILKSDLADEFRPKLEPFVLRLAGSADSPEIEQKRAAYMALRTVNEILPLALLKIGLTAEASACKAATDLGKAKRIASAAAEAAYVAADAADAAGAKWGGGAAYVAADAANAAAEAEPEAESERAAECAARAARAAARAGADRRDVFNLMINILDGALAIGKQADEVDMDIVRARREQILELTN